MHQLLLEQHLPHAADVRVGFRFAHAPIQPAFHILMHEQVLKRRQRRVQQAAVLRYVLFLDHADFLIQPAPGFLRPQRGGVHIVVHRLLLRRRDHVGREHVDRHGLLSAHVPAHRVVRVTMVRDSRAAGHDLRVAPDQLLRVHAGRCVQIIGVAVQMIKVLQQREIERVANVRVGHALRQMRRQVYRQLLVADRVLQRRLFRGLQMRKQLLLLLLAATNQRQLAAQLVVARCAGKLMRKPYVFKLRAVHQNDARARVSYLMNVII